MMKNRNGNRNLFATIACFVFFVAFGSAALAGAGETYYENAEDGTTSGWRIYDRTPAGAFVDNVYDSARGGRVIEMSGAGTGNGFLLRNANFTPWGNRTQFMIEWSMNFAEPFRLFVDLDTTAGHRYLIYEPVDVDALGGGTNIRYGLGSGSDDGDWVTIVRDLRADVAGAQPGVGILSVNGFLVRGSGRLDDLRLWAPVVATVYEDAEDATTVGWDIYDATPPGATLNNVFDLQRGSRVIEVSGTDYKNGFRLRNDDFSRWDNGQQFFIEWRMRFSQWYRIYVDVNTTSGQRYLLYEPADGDELGGNGTIHHGLGSDTDEGAWVTVARDLQADFADAEPGGAILAVNGFLVRGSGRLDDIRLRAIPRTKIYEDAEDAGIVGWDVYDATPAGAFVDNVFDAARGGRVIELTGNGRGNGFRLREEDLTAWDNADQLVLEWSMNFAEPFRLFVDLDTTAGHRYLIYEPVDVDALGGGTNIRYGLGSGSDDGEWATFVRDLRADVAGAQPGVEILAVKGLLVRGSGRLDDIALGFDANVGGLDIEFNGGVVDLAWSRPAGVDVDWVEIRRRDDGEYPQGPEDGVLVAQLPVGQQTLTDLFIPDGSLGDSMHYAAFWHGPGGVRSRGARTAVYCDASMCVTVPELRGLTDINTAADVDLHRRSLIGAIWGVDTLPARLPDGVVQLGPPDDPNSGRSVDYRPPNAVLTEQIFVDPQESFFYADFEMRLYSPAAPNGKLVVYHGGHRGIPDTRHPILERFLDEGYAVLDVSMPMAGFNFDRLYHPPYGSYHEDIALLEQPMRIFFEQLAVGLNYLTTTRGYDDIYMVGISGGGWTAVVYAAIDQRIKASYPVAGSNPVFLTEQLGDVGDFEQVYPDFYRRASYLDLYLLGAAGRRQLLVYNVFDDCCFAGTFPSVFKDRIRTNAARLGGSFDIVLDDTFVGHQVSPYALDIIVADMANN